MAEMVGAEKDDMMDGSLASRRRLRACSVNMYRYRICICTPRDWSDHMYSVPEHAKDSENAPYKGIYIGIDTEIFLPNRP